ncbi:MAG TPA: acyl-CoA dehydrogenase, partial [Rhizobiales bacterium]|nr:acyl-CoA dehydrogenase [Hyphomicrobiales bacterium]
MDFSFSEEQERLRDTVRRFARAELRDVARQVEDDDRPAPREIVRRYAGLGFLGVNIAREYGGGGMSHLDAVLVLEEVAQVSPAVAFPIFESSFGPILAIEHFAPEELRQRVIPKVCSGEMTVAVAMSEPNAGTALTDLKTSASVAGGKIVVNGQKRWCS